MASREAPHRPPCRTGLHLARMSSFDPDILVHTSPPALAIRGASNPSIPHQTWHSGVPPFEEMTYTHPAGMLFSDYDEQTRRAMMETMASQDPGQLADLAGHTEPPFFFIDEYSATRVLLDVNLHTPRGVFFLVLEHASSEIATQVKADFTPARGRNGNITYFLRQRFSFEDGPFLYRFITKTHGPGGQRAVTSTTWETITPRSYHLLFEGPGATAGRGFFVEIQHTLQRVRLFGPRRAPLPPLASAHIPISPPVYQQRGPVVWHLASQPLIAAEVPASAKSAPAALYAQPVAAFLRRFDDVERRPPPIAPALARAIAPDSPPPPPAPSPAPTCPIVRMPPVSAPAAINDPFPLPGPVALAVTPVSTGWASGVVDSAALRWYRREEELREAGCLRFGDAEAVESLDIWRGW